MIFLSSITFNISKVFILPLFADIFQQTAIVLITVVLILFLSTYKFNINGIPIGRKALARGSMYLLLLIFFIFYVTYFHQYVQYVFAATATSMNIWLNNTINSGVTLTYPSGSNATANTTPAGIQVTLLRNGTTVATGANLVSEIINQLAAGVWNYTAYFAGNATYTASSTQQLLTINQATPSVNLIGAFNVTYGTASTLSCIANNIDPTKCSLFLNLTTAVPTNQTGLNNTATILGAAWYNATANYSATQNYSAVNSPNSSMLIYFNVSKANMNITLNNNTASVNTSGLIGYWRFEEGSGTTAGDSSGYGNTANFIGTVNWAAGMFGNGVNVTQGTNNNYVKLTNFATNYYLTNTSQMSIVFWVYATGTDGNTTGNNFIWFGSDNGGFDVRVLSTADSNKTCVKNVGIWDYFCSNSPIPLNQWVQVAVVYNNRATSLYHNQVLVGSYTFPDGVLTSSGNYDLYYPNTNCPSCSWPEYHGDEVQIWNRSLSADEIAELYQSQVTYGTTTTFTGSNCASSNNAISCSLYRNNTNITGTENGTAITLPAGLSYYIYNTSGNANFTSTNILLPVNVSKATPTLSLSGSNVTYPTSVSVTGSTTDTGNGGCTYTLYRNATTVGTGTSVTDSTKLGAGWYSYVYNTSGCANYTSGTTSALGINVSKGSPTVTIGTIQNVTYPTTVTAYCTSNDDAGTGCKLYRNTTSTIVQDVTSAENNTAIKLGAAWWNYTANVSSSTNWTANSNVSYVTISQAAGTVTIGNIQNVTYPNTITAFCGSNNNDAGASCKLFRNTTSLIVQDVTSVENNTAIILGSAWWNYTANQSSTQNYTFATNTSYVTISQATPTVSVYGNFNTTYPTSSTWYCSSTNGDSGARCSLFFNMTTAVPANQTAYNNTAVKLNAGWFNITANSTSTQNYTSTNSPNSSMLIYSQQSKATPTVNIYGASNITYTTSTTIFCSNSNDDSGSACSTFLNLTTAVPASITNNSAITLNAGWFNTTANATSTQNYTAVNSPNSSMIVYFQISQASPTVSTIGALNVTFPTSSTLACTSTNGDANARCSIFLNLTTASPANWTTNNNTAIQLNYGWFNVTSNQTASQNYSAVNSGNSSMKIYFQISQATPTVNVIGAANVTYPTSSTLACTSTNGDTGARCSLFLNLTTTVPANQTQLNNTATVLNSGWFNVTANSTATQNYTATNSPNASMLVYFQITQASPVLSISMTNNNTAYGSTDTTQCSRTTGDSSSTVTLYRNGTQVASGTSSPQQEAVALGAGNWNYTCAIGSSQNYTAGSTANNYFVVSQASSTVSVIGAANVTYPTSSTLACTSTNGDTGARCSLFLNLTTTVPANQTQLNNTATVLNSGWFNVTANSTATQNYSATNSANSSMLIYFQVNKTVPTLVLSNNTASVNTSGLVGYWRFDAFNSTNETIDYSGQGNDGVGYNFSTNPASVVPGMFRNGVQFNGANWIQIADSPSFQWTNNFTIAAWVNRNTSAGGDVFIKRFDAAGGGDSLEFIIGSNGQISGIVVDSVSTVKSVASNTLINSDQWYYVVLVSNSTHLIIYINNTQDATAASTLTPRSGTCPATIGAAKCPSISSNLFNGTMDEVQIWKRSLTADEIAELYQSKVTYGTTTTFTGSNCSPSGGSDVSCTLWRNDTVSATSSDNATSVTLPAGWNYYVYNTSGGQNYTPSNILLPINVSAGTPTVSVLGAANVSYGTASTLACTSTNNDAGARCSMFMNLTTTTPSNQTQFNNTPTILNVGWFNITGNSTATQNYTATNSANSSMLIYFNISPSTSTVSISLTGNNSVYPSSTTASCARTIGDSSSTITLLRNGTSVASGTSPQSETATLPGGNSNYTCTVSTTQNYTSGSQTDQNMYIRKGNVSVILNPYTQAITYGTSSTPYCSINGTTVDIDPCSLWRNNVNITGTENNTAIAYGAGTYTFVGNTTATQNYSASAQNTSTLTVNPASLSISLYLNGTQANSNSYYTARGANFTVVSSVSGKTVNLDTNITGWTTVSGTTSLSNYTTLNSAGTYNVTGYFTGDANYSASSTTYYATVNPLGLVPTCTSGGSYGANSTVTVVGSTSFNDSSAGSGPVEIDIINAGTIKATKNVTSSPEGKFINSFTNLDLGSYSANISATVGSYTGTCQTNFIISSAANCTTGSKNLTVSGYAYDYNTGSPINSGSVTITVKETEDSGTASFNNGYWTLTLKACIVSNQRYTLGIRITDSNGKSSYTQSGFISP